MTILKKRKKQSKQVIFARNSTRSRGRKEGPHYWQIGDLSHKTNLQTENRYTPQTRQMILIELVYLLCIRHTIRWHRRPLSKKHSQLIKIQWQDIFEKLFLFCKRTFIRGEFTRTLPEINWIAATYFYSRQGSVHGEKYMRPWSIRQSREISDVVCTLGGTGQPSIWRRWGLLMINCPVFG